MHIRTIQFNILESAQIGSHRMSYQFNNEEDWRIQLLFDRAISRDAVSTIRRKLEKFYLQSFPSFFITFSGENLVEIHSIERKLKGWLGSSQGDVNEAFKRICALFKEKGDVLDLSNLGLSELPPELGMLKGLKKLHLDGNPLKSVPNTLSALKDLDIFSCVGCENLEVLPERLHCRQFDCSGCVRLKKLPLLDLCEFVFCKGSLQLKELPGLPCCVELDCSECRALEEIGALPICGILTCKGATLLKALPYDLSQCRFLDCSGCTSLKVILSDLDECRHFNCSDCTGLTRIESDFPSLIYYKGCHTLSNPPMVEANGHPLPAVYLS